jgi:UDP-2-acetamido-3-amino-2,3-dideoxy-glucuronate N-acetyltransferase
MSRYGVRLDLPLQGQAEAKCPAAGQRYRLNHTTLEILED